MPRLPMGGTALFIASENVHLEVVRALLPAGADDGIDAGVAEWASGRGGGLGQSNGQDKRQGG
jgi:ankyrin repeat protein